MKQVTNLTDSPNQRFQITLDNGELAEFRLYYYVTQNSWFFDFSYNDYTCNCERVVLTYNALRHLKNIIPFGISFLTDGEAEPFKIDDFSSQRVKMYILNQEEVKEIENEIYYA